MEIDFFRYKRFEFEANVTASGELTKKAVRCIPHKAESTKTAWDPGIVLRHSILIETLPF